MSSKEFKNIDEQIEILQSRGLSISDIDYAKNFLYRNNYYRVSGYSLTLRDHDIFSQNANFQNIIDIYEFDSNLRHILLKYIEIIEVTIKSIYAYEFSKEYGPTEYLNILNFIDSEKHSEIIKKAETQKQSRLPHEAYLKHFVEDRNEPIPLWAYVDLLTISNISILYSISQPKLKMTIASAMGLNVRGDKILEHFLHSITIIRNLCAHGGRLYNRPFQQKPWLSKKEKNLLIVQSDGQIDNAHLYGFIIIMKRMLEPNVFKAMKSEIVSLSKKYFFVNMRHYGFRNDWEKVL